jgi:hypothetical protein
MGANALQIKKAVSVAVECTVTGLNDLAGYTSTLTAAASMGGTAVIEKTGTHSGLVITFALSKALTDVDEKIYYYDIVITDGTNEYSLVQDILEIEKSVSNS